MTVVSPICLCASFFVSRSLCVLLLALFVALCATTLQTDTILKTICFGFCGFTILTCTFCPSRSAIPSSRTATQTIAKLFLDHKTTRHLYRFDDFFSSALLLHVYSTGEKKPEKRINKMKNSNPRSSTRLSACKWTRFHRYNWGSITQHHKRYKRNMIIRWHCNLFIFIYYFGIQNV